MTTNLNDYITDYKEFRIEFRGDLVEQFKHEMYNKSFSNFDRFSVSVTLQDRIESWFISNIDRSSIPNNVYDYSVAETVQLLRTALDLERKQQKCIEISRKKEFIEYL